MLLASGTFLTGTNPAFYSGEAITGSIITAVGTDSAPPTLTAASVAAQIRDNTGLSLLQCDLNGDEAIDAANAAAMFANWGASGAGDCSNDGLVEAADPSILFTEWTGDSAADSDLAFSLVPEPDPRRWFVIEPLGSTVFRRSSPVHPRRSASPRQNVSACDGGWGHRSAPSHTSKTAPHESVVARITKTGQFVLPPPAPYNRAIARLTGPFRPVAFGYPQMYSRTG